MMSGNLLYLTFYSTFLLLHDFTSHMKRRQDLLLPCPKKFWMRKLYEIRNKIIKLSEFFELFKVFKLFKLFELFELSDRCTFITKDKFKFQMNRTSSSLSSLELVKSMRFDFFLFCCP